MRFKRILAFISAFCLVLSFAGCKKEEDAKNSGSTADSAISSESEANSADSAMSSENEANSTSDESEKDSDSISENESNCSLDEEANAESALLEGITESLYGTWIVEKTVAYEGPLKEIARQMYDIYYYEGAEYNFREDGICDSDVGFSSTFEVISDTQITGVSITDGQEYVHDYELNGDELVLYGMYTGSYANYGRCGAIYFKRK